MAGVLATDLGIISELGKLDVVEQTAGCLDDVFALLWSFLHFPCKEKAASSSHLHKERVYTVLIVHVTVLLEQLLPY